MTLLYGRAANGNYYPIQVSDDGRIISILGEGSLIRPDQTAEFKNLLLNNPANAFGPGLGFYGVDSFLPALGSCNSDGSGFVPASGASAQLAGNYTVIDELIFYDISVNITSKGTLNGPCVALGEIPLPLGAGYAVANYSSSWPYWEGIRVGGKSPLAMSVYVYKQTSSKLMVVPSYSVETSGFPTNLQSTQLSVLPAYLAFRLNLRVYPSAQATNLAAAPPPLPPPPVG